MRFLFAVWITSVVFAWCNALLFSDKLPPREQIKLALRQGSIAAGLLGAIGLSWYWFLVG